MFRGVQSLRLVEATRRVQRIKRKSLAGQCVLVLIALQILFLGAFITVELPTATGHNLLNYGHLQAQRLIDYLPSKYQAQVYEAAPELAGSVKKIRYDSYSPEAPIAIFLGYCFGTPIAPLAAALFVLAGLVGPAFGVYLFASGGGFEYYAQPGFGYLLGMILVAFLVGKITEKARTSLRQVAGLAAGVVSLHLVGILYVLGCSLAFAFSEGGAGGPNWQPWVFEQLRNLSWYSLPYDAFFGFVLIGLGFPIRYLVGVLTAPDIGLKSKADVLAQQQIEEILQY